MGYFTNTKTLENDSSVDFIKSRLPCVRMGIQNICGGLKIDFALKGFHSNKSCRSVFIH